MLATLSVVAVAGFLVTRAAAQAAERQRLEDAETWFHRGERDLVEGRLVEAVAALQRASGIDRGSREYRLTLARALAASGQDEAAQRTLLPLREAAPEDPDVNLALARLEVARANVQAAVSYYRSALYGAWDPERLGQRERLRIEFVRYLLQRGLRERALAELLVRATDLPDAVDPQVETAELLLEAGDAARALALFIRALRLDGQHQAAIVGAARAATSLRDFGRAQRLLRNATTQDSEVASLRELVELVLANDPLQPRLPSVERRRRIAAALEWGAAYARRCLPPADREADGLLAAIDALQVSLKATRAADLPGVGETVVAALAALDERVSAACPALAPADRAWLLIVRRGEPPSV